MITELPLSSPKFWAPSKIEVQIKEMISEDVVIKIMIIRYFLPPFSRFGKVGVLFVRFFFLACQDYLDESGPYFQKRGYVPVYFEYNNFNFIF